MIDIHSHIIPGIDDGAKDAETSDKMLQIAKNSGTKAIFATPHYYRGRFETSYNDVLLYTDELNKRIEDLKILPGQEVYIDNYTLQAYDSGTIGTLNNTKYMLLELPFDYLRGNETDIIYELRIKGIVPIIAHPERYSYIMQNPSNINSFIDEGCLFQINSGSLDGVFGRDVKKTANILIENGICSFIASDAHSTGIRCPSLKNTYKNIKLQDSKLLETITKNAKLLLINGEIKSTAIYIKPRKKHFWIF